MPDEIIVKFRTPTPAAKGVEGSPDDKVGFSQSLRTPGQRFRVREMRPIVKDFDRRQTQLRPLGDSDQSRLTPKQRRLLRRQKRAAATARRPELGNIYRVLLDLDADESLEKVLAEYRSRPDVEYAEVNPIISACVTPNDPSYADQWALSKIHAAEAWDTCRGSSDVVVAVLDTGVDYDHPDLQGNLWANEAERDGQPWVDDDHNGYVDDIRGYNFVAYNNDPRDDHGHGTAITGIIAAVGNNGTNTAGVCWTVRIMPVKILGADGEGTAADAVPAIYYAVANGADIISGSWGGAEASSALGDAIACAHAEGVVVVAAAGNSNSGEPYYPAAYPEVISVAATDSNDQRWYLSNYGDWVDLAAPGHSIVSLRAELPGQVTRTRGLSRMSGTSLAAPHVSGACALLLAADPFLRCDELHRILTATADPIQPGICASNGRLNVYAALRAVIPPEGTIRMDRTYYAEGADIGLLLADWRLRGAGHFTVTVATAGGDQEAVALRETNVSLGVLRGTIISQNAAVMVGDGVLQVHDGEGIEAGYLGADDGLGHAGEWRQAIAIADFKPPAVVSVEAKPQTSAATIEIHTSEPTRAEVRFGVTAAGPFASIQKDPAFREQHSVPLRGLVPQTQYYFVLAIVDEAGNEAVADNNGQNYSFATGAPSP
ncbi:MAG: S8 family serine peptidase [Planctomycetes bacterium]|nr:S8 family serine peptidase [Planctomycetota bacterium]